MVQLERALAAPALLAPFSLLFPWAAVPSKLGVAMAGPRYFLHWATKYPNFGSINTQVVLGIACLLAVAVLPAAAASYRLAGGRRGSVAIALAVMAVIAWVPVLVRLDVALAAVGFFGAHTLLGVVSAPSALGGPAIRMLAVASTVALAVLAARGAPRSSADGA